MRDVVLTSSNHYPYSHVHVRQFATTWLDSAEDDIWRSSPLKDAFALNANDASPSTKT